MYPEDNKKEFEKINELLNSATALLKGSRTMQDIFYLTMKRNERKIAVNYINEKNKIKKYRYWKMRSHSYAIASILSQFLLQKEKHLPIVLKLANGPHWGEIFWAILMAGYKPLLIDAKTSKEGTQNLINQSKAVAIISEDNHSYSVLRISIGDILNEKHAYSFSPTWENEVIFSSSGTTGDVKLMVFNGENLCHQINAAIDMAKTTKDIMYPNKYGQIKILAMVPFHHIFGFVAVFLWYTFYGKTLVFPNSNTPSDVQYICQKCGVTHVFSVPLFWDSLATSIQRKASMAGANKQKILDNMIGYKTGKITKEEAGTGGTFAAIDTVQRGLLGNKIRFCISGGGYLNSATSTIINGIGYNLYNGYGMTEVGVTSVELSPLVEIRLKGKIGKPLYGIDYKILPSKDKNNIGELLIKSPTTHIREIIGGVETNANIDTEGYFHTGDIAEVDNAGGYYIRGRIKDIIINADGENIFPDELELFFKDLPHVINLSVLGIKVNNTNQENIVLVLEVDNKITPSQINGIQEEVNKIVPNLPHKVTISDIYLAKQKLPLANNMKVKRYVIKREIEANSKNFISINSKKETKKFDDVDPNIIGPIIKKLEEIFSKVLILPIFKINDDDHWINDLGGDSMNYVEMVQEVTSAFNMVIPEDQYGQLTCINDFAYYIVKNSK